MHTKRNILIDSYFTYTHGALIVKKIFDKCMDIETIIKVWQNQIYNLIKLSI